MDLNERAKIKQEIVQEIGYKTAIKETVLCNDKYSKCYIVNNRLMLKTIILGEALEYKLSGHPYEPVIHLDCVTDTNKSFSIHGEDYFPNNNDNNKEWVSFVTYLNGRILLNQYECAKEEYIPQPNQKVAIENRYNSWYLCISDEKNILDISGPFIKDTMVYLLANKEQKVYFENYKYTDIEKERYIHIHYRSLSDIRNCVLPNLFTYKDEIYEICEWKEGIEVRNIHDNKDIKFIYGLNIETSSKISSLNGNIYGVEELFNGLTKMFDDNTTDSIPYLKK